MPLARSASSTDGGLEPAHHRVEVAQRVEATDAELAVHEIEPQPLADEHERRPFAQWARHVGQSAVSEAEK